MAFSTPMTCRRLANTSAGLCRACLVRSTIAQPFSTSAARAIIAPESPDFIHIPQPPQPSYRPRFTVKGILPVPRSVIRARGHEQTSASYLARTIPAPKSPLDLSTISVPAGSDLPARLAWRERMAAARRRSLQEGLAELHQRKARAAAWMAARQTRALAERDAALTRKQREDERLTAATLTQDMKPRPKGVLPDVNRAARIAAAHVQMQETQGLQEARRKQMLHALYTNARSFITTEVELEHEIDRLFVPQPAEWGYADGADSIWSRGPPEAIQDMINATTRPNLSAKKHGEQATLISKRVREIAGELTGGPIESDDALDDKDMEGRKRRVESSRRARASA
ncbi:MAG: hypothetical protein M1826_000018 [Phylliscum demangeonii]|nr:MAG: hypothetical protein M1826_000018 [Phylliscum demangeonii]